MNLLIRCGEEAYWPIGSIHDAGWAECREDGVEVRSEILAVPALPAGLGDHAGDLASDVRVLCELADVFTPGGELASGNLRLGDVIEDEALVWQSFDELDRSGKLAGVDQNVIGQIEFLQASDAAEEFRAQHEGVIGFVLHDVANADEARVSGELSELLIDACTAEIDPADNAADERVFGRER